MRFATLQLGLLLLLPLMAAGAPPAASLVEAVQRDTAWLSGYPSRVPGTAGHDAAAAALLARLRELPHVQVLTQEYPVTVPAVTRCELVVTEGELRGTHRLFPVWPDLARLKATPERGISGELVYIGTGSYADLSPRRLRGQIAVLEMSHYGNWKRALAFGAAAVVLLGGPDDHALPPAQQAILAPRYYVPAGPLAEALRNASAASGTIQCDAEWRQATACNIYAALAGPAVTAQAPPPLALAVAYDSMSVVMDQAPGADNAVDTALLLNLLRAWSAAPPPRAVLACFVDAVGINQLGVRQMLAGLAIHSQDRTRLDYQRLDLERLQDYDLTAQQTRELGEDAGALAQLWDKRRFRQLQRYLKDVLGTEILQLKEGTGALRLRLPGTFGPRRVAIEQQLTADLARLTLLNDTLHAILTQVPLTPETQAVGTAAWATVCRRVTAQAAVLRAEVDAFAQYDSLRARIRVALGRDAAAAVPVGFVLGLDLSDAGITVGPATYCGHLITNESNAGREFIRWFRQLRKDPEDSFWRTAPQVLVQLGDKTSGMAPATPASAVTAPARSAGVRALIDAALNDESFTGVEDARSFAVGSLGVITSPVSSFSLTGVTWATLDGLRRRVDTPQDTAARLDWQRLRPQIVLTALVVQRLLEGADFAPTPKLDSASRPRWRLGNGSVVTESMAETVPRTPMPGLLVTLVGGSHNWPGPEGGIGIRRHEFVRTGPDGRFRFPPLPGNADPAATELQVQAFQLDGRGRITRGIADQSSMVAGRLSASVILTEGPSATPARVVAFECQELNGPEFFDPRFLEPLSQYSLLDVSRGGAPKRSHLSIHQGQMFGLVPPGTHWQLILRSGAAGATRMALLNVAPDLVEANLSLRQALHTGYPVGETLPPVPAHLAAKDFHLVDTWRLDRFRRAGVTSPPIEAIHKETARLLAAADQALTRDHGDLAQRYADTALANEVRAYEALRATGDDVTRGAIFLMLLLVPFAIAMERLLFACARVGWQIVAASGVFGGMTAVLWSFHPAFRITAQPLIIVMAFAVLLLSLLVIIMIIRKFEADLELIRSGRAEASGAQTRRVSIIASAAWLGLATMRKRKLRTALTGITIGLITFALLCFSSSARYQEKREFRVRGAETPAPGVLLRDPQWRPLSARALPTVENLLAGSGLRAVPRYWVTAIAPTWRLHVRNPVGCRQASLKAGLGLHPLEEGLTRPSRFVPDWPRFAGGNGCYLSRATAADLGLAPGDPVLVGGFELRLTGTFEARAVEQELKTLDGASLLPFDYSVQTEAQWRDPKSVEAALASGVGLEPDPGAAHVSGDDLIVIPAAIAPQLGGTLRSIGVRAPSAEAARTTALNLMQVLAFPVYFGAGSLVKTLVATPLLPRPSRKMLIPLLIASLIIFTTMINSVAERKSEIHVYTSLGLAPQHVGMLFVSEAAAYGLMGSIFGYVVGQGLATVLTKLNWMGGITLNYSGSNVAFTMGLVLTVVIVSAIVPAIMASRLATPSRDMHWTVPKPQGGVIRDTLPFTVTVGAARGLVTYIYEYLDAHREGSIGVFTSADLRPLAGQEGRVAGVSAVVWLAPYDLGVRQHLEIDICPDVEDICNIHLQLVHNSGDEDAWRRLNKAFLGDLRRQFLGWHKVKPGRVVQYIREADALFEPAD